MVWKLYREDQRDESEHGREHEPRPGVPVDESIANEYACRFERPVPARRGGHGHERVPVAQEVRGPDGVLPSQSLAHAGDDTGLVGQIDLARHSSATPRWECRSYSFSASNSCSLSTV